MNSKTFFLIMVSCLFWNIHFSTFSYAKAADGWLGVTVREMTPSMRDEFGLGNRFGLLITRVVHDSPADEANLKEDDVILKYGDTSVEKGDVFAGLVRHTSPGTAVDLLVWREGGEHTINVTIGKRGQPRPFHFSWNDDGNVLVFGRPRLGVSVHSLDEDLAGYFNVEAGHGVLVTEVSSDSPAEKAGIKAGDVITAIDTVPVDSPEDLMRILRDYEEDAEVTVHYIRKGKTAELTVALQGGSAYRFKIKKLLEDHDFDIELPNFDHRDERFLEWFGMGRESI